MIYPLSLHDALPIFLTNAHVIDGARRIDVASDRISAQAEIVLADPRNDIALHRAAAASSRSTRDRKSTRLNSSHVEISYAVFCLKKKKKKKTSKQREESPVHEPGPSAARVTTYRRPIHRHDASRAL